MDGLCAIPDARITELVSLLAWLAMLGASSVYGVRLG
jgi:hypothetical protein